MKLWSHSCSKEVVMKKLFVFALMLGLMSCLAQAQSVGTEVRGTDQGLRGLAASQANAAQPAGQNIGKAADLKQVARDGNIGHANMRDSRGNTTLHEAARGLASGEIHVPNYGYKPGVRSQVEEFLGAGVKPEVNNRGLSPIGAAMEGAMKPHSDKAACEGAVCALLNSGAEVTDKDKKKADKALARNKITGLTMMKIEERMREQEAARRAAEKAKK